MDGGTADSYITCEDAPMSRPFPPTSSRVRSRRPFLPHSSPTCSLPSAKTLPVRVCIKLTNGSSVHSTFSRATRFGVKG